MEDDPPVGLRPDEVAATKVRDDRPEGVTETPTIGHNGGPPLDDCAAGIPIQKLAFSIAEAAASTALSRSLLYELIRDGELKSFTVRGRRRRLIYVDDLRALLLGERAAANGPIPCAETRTRPGAALRKSAHRR
jgi:excisionase family DNA binding protein